MAQTNKTLVLNLVGSMEETTQVITSIDRAEVILCNLLALSIQDNGERGPIRVPSLDVVVSLETAVSLLREEQESISMLNSNQG